MPESNGLCNRCRDQQGKIDKDLATTRIMVESISVCRSCGKEYWTASGEPTRH